MAFGDLLGTLSGGSASITNPISATGSVAVAVGDLITVAIAEQTSLTATTVTDNLGNTYTAVNAGTDIGVVSGRTYYSVVTVAGTVTSIDVAATASADDVAVVAACFTGPFVPAPWVGLDANPANAADNTTPYTAPATGARLQEVELVVCSFACSGANTYTATSPNLKAVQNAFSANANISIGYQVTANKTTLSPAWTGTAPGASVHCTFSFRRAGDAVRMVRTADPAGVSASGNVATYSGVSIGAASATDRIIQLSVGTELTGATINSATIDYGSGDVAMTPMAQATFGDISTRNFWLEVPSGTTATFKVTFGANPNNTQNHVSVYSVTGAYAAPASGSWASTSLSANLNHIAYNGNNATTSAVFPLTAVQDKAVLFAAQSAATDTSARAWNGFAGNDLDEDAGAFRWTTALTTASVATYQNFSATGGALNEDGTLAWVSWQPKTNGVSVFGDLKSFGGRWLASNVNPLQPLASVRVAVGDLVVVTTCELVSNTTTGVTDDLGHTGIALTASGLLKAYYYIVTVAGDATISAATTASANDVALAVAVYAGPFDTLDQNPAVLSDATTPFVSNLSGTLSQADELVVGYFSQTANSVDGGYNAPSPGDIDVQVSSSLTSSPLIAITSKVVAATTSLTNQIANPGGNNFTTLCGIATFKKLIATPGAGAAAAVASATATGESTAASAGASAASASATATGASTAVSTGAAAASASATAVGTGIVTAAGSSAASASASGVSEDAGITTTGDGASAAVASASGVGSSTAVSTGAAAASATATGVGASTAASAGAAAATASTTGTGASTASSPGSAAAVANATAVGTAIKVAAGAAAAIANATAVGSSTAISAGAAAAIAVATATGSSTVVSAGAAAAVASASGVGASTAVAAGAATSSASATGTGKATSVSAGSAAASASATGVGSSTAASPGSAAAIAASTAVGVGTCIAYDGDAFESTAFPCSAATGVSVAAGSAAAVASATAVGTGIVTAVGSAAASASATGVGAATAASAGSAAASASATGVGSSTASSAGSAAASASATGTGRSTAASSGSAAAVANAAGVGRSTAVAVGSAAAVANATGYNDSATTATGTATATSSASAVGLSTAVSAGSSTAAASATAAGQSTAAADGAAAAAATAVGFTTSVSTGTGSASATANASGIITSFAVADGYAIAGATATGYALVYYPDSEAMFVPVESRTMAVQAENRSFIVPLSGNDDVTENDDLTLSIPIENRVMVHPPKGVVEMSVELENRVMTVPDRVRRAA